MKKKKIIISGDVLFYGSIGRTDLPGGNHKSLISNIKTKLFSFDDDFVVFPGHGQQTSIGFEKNNNPFFTS
ncbi:MAG: MBL fold metallo-hydrolase [Bacteroidota bacterium]